MFPAAPLPERIGPYRVLRRLPAGGGADLYLGREEGPLGFARTVVLKLAPLADDPSLAEELAREAAVVAKLNHPAILRMFNFFQHEDRLVLVLEHVEGTHLGRVLAAGRRRGQALPDEVVYYVASRLVSALAHAHGMVDETGARTPVVHRAISPASLVLGWDGSVRLSGFGLAKIMGLSPDTALGLIKGTPGYMAPEQMRGERVSERVDVYQAGLVIWEMLSGNPPAAANTQRKTRQAELVQMMGGERLASVSLLRPTLPREIAAILDAALEPAPEKRTITSAEMERWFAKTVDIDAGREGLRELAVLLRPASARVATPQPDGRSSQGSMRGRRPVAAARFPGAAVRATGRPSERPGEAPPASIRRVLPAPRSAPPPPRSLRSASLVPGGPAISALPLPPSDLQPLGAPSVAPPARDAAPLREASLAAPQAPAPESPAALAASDGAHAIPALAPETLDDTEILSRARPRRPIGVAVGAACLLGLTLLGALLLARRGDDTSVPGALAGPSASGAGPAPSAAEPAVSAEPAALTPPPGPAPEGLGAIPPLSPGSGAVYARTEIEGEVYLNGTRYGETRKTLVVPCGQKFFRVGKPAGVVGKRITWLTRGSSVLISCGAVTELVPPPGSPRSKP